MLAARGEINQLDFIIIYIKCGFYKSFSSYTILIHNYVRAAEGQWEEGGWGATNMLQPILH
jgi:hypothetical protein